MEETGTMSWSSPGTGKLQIGGTKEAQERAMKKLKQLAAHCKYGAAPVRVAELLREVTKASTLMFRLSPVSRSSDSSRFG